MSTTRADSAAFHGVPTTTARISSAASREVASAGVPSSPATQRGCRHLPPAGSAVASGPNTTVPTTAGRNVNDAVTATQIHRRRPPLVSGPPAWCCNLRVGAESRV